MAQWLVCALLYQSFVDALTDGNARLGADVDRFSFIVSDFHRLLLAGLPAHFESDVASHQHAPGAPCARSVFGGAVSKDTVSRVWRKVQGDWDGVEQSLARRRSPRNLIRVVRLILDGTVVRVRLDKKATSISLLVVLGVREDGQKVLLAVKNMGGETNGGLAGGSR